MSEELLQAIATFALIAGGGLLLFGGNPQPNSGPTRTWRQWAIERLQGAPVQTPQTPYQPLPQVNPIPNTPTLERDHTKDYAALKQLEARFAWLENSNACDACSFLRREFFVRGQDHEQQS